MLLVDVRKYEKKEINSIDELKELLIYGIESETEPQDVGITPEEEFWGHCSNLQTWDELDYNTNIIHSNLGFPLLEKLTKSGDNKAKRVFRKEIIRKFEKIHLPTIAYLLKEGYMEYLTREEKSVLSLETNKELLIQINNHIKSKNKKDILTSLLVLSLLYDLIQENYTKKLIVTCLKNCVEYFLADELADIYKYFNYFSSNDYEGKRAMCTLCETDYEGKRAMCTLCETESPITFLPLREVHKILNKKGLSLKQTVFHPSINNYCEKCGDELYDDGRCVTSPCCNAKAIKHFVQKTVVVPNYMFKHEFNKLYSELKHVKTPKEQDRSKREIKVEIFN